MTDETYIDVEIPDYGDAPWSDEKEYTPEELARKEAALGAVLQMVAAELSGGILITQDMVDKEDGEYAHPELEIPLVKVYVLTITCFTKSWLLTISQTWKWA